MIYPLPFLSLDLGEPGQGKSQSLDEIQKRLLDRDQDRYTSENLLLFESWQNVSEKRHVSENLL